MSTTNPTRRDAFRSTERASGRRPSARRYALALLGVYTVAVPCVEPLLRTTAVESPLRALAGINTTLCLFLAWGTALIHAIGLMTASAEERGAERWFFVSQVVVFGYLGAYDRFLLGASSASLLGGGADAVLLALVVVEMALLLTLGRVTRRPADQQRKVGGAAALFGLLLPIGLGVARPAPFVASVAGLAKTWALAWLFLFAWDMCTRRIERLRARVDLVAVVAGAGRTP